MKSVAAAASAAVVLVGLSSPVHAQVGNPATPQVGRPQSSTPVGPPAPVRVIAPLPRSGPLPQSLDLIQSLEEAAARSPAVVAAQAEVTAAEARVRQSDVRSNPELSFEVENFAGTGELRGMRSAEATLAVNQRLDLGGRRSARVRAAQAEVAVQRLRLAIARADLSQSVREQFARAIAARETLEQAEETVERAQELARITGILVDAGRDPPLRAVRARSALAQARAEREAAAADELSARSSLAALFGVSIPVRAVRGTALDLTPQQVVPEASLEARLAEAERLAAQARVLEQTAEARIDPAVGVGVRHVRETGDFGLVAGVSMPLRVFDRNRGNIDAARANLTAAEARQASIQASTRARARNALVAVEAAQRRVAALGNSALPEAREGLRLTQRSYEEGRSTLLELIDAQNAYTQAQRTLTEARLALALATAELGRISAQ